MKLKSINKYLFVLLAIATIFLLPAFSFAQSYQLLEPIEGENMSVTSVETPEQYLELAFKYLSRLVVALAVLMLVVGGVEYTLTWASDSKKGEAKNRIENALIGLILFLVSYLVLYTINPNLVTFKLSNIGAACAGQGQQASTGGGGGAYTGNVGPRPTGGGTGNNLGGGNSGANSLKKLAGSQVPSQNMAEIERIYGKAGDTSQETIVKFQGKDLRVNKKAAAAFEKWSNDIDAYNANRVAKGLPPYRINTVGGYAYRQNVNDPSKQSIHSYGIAIDINEGNNGNGSSSTDMPDDFVELSYKNGFRWGGEWPPGRTVIDPMHFEYIGGGGYVNPRDRTQTITSITPISVRAEGVAVETGTTVQSGGSSRGR